MVKNNLRKFISIILFSFFFSQIAEADIISAENTPTGGTYISDQAETSERVFMPSMNTVKFVDFFLCVMNMRTDLYPNAVYRALVNETECNKIRGDDPDGTAIEFADATMSCTRADNNSTQICKVWYTTADGDRILTGMELDTSPTSSRPNGEFAFTYVFTDPSDPSVLDWDNNAGELIVDVIDGVTNVKMFLNMESNVCSGSSCAEELIKYSLDLDLSDHKLSSATGAIGEDFTTDALDGVYTLDFNGSFALAKLAAGASRGGNQTTCTATTTENLTSIAYNYDIYDMTTGVKKQVGGGFPSTVKTVQVGSGAAVGDDAYFNFWGAWAESGDPIHGDVLTVSRDNVSLGLSADEDITVHVAGGRLEQVNEGTNAFHADDIRDVSENDTAGLNATVASTKLKLPYICQWLPNESTPAYNCIEPKAFIDTTGDNDATNKIRLASTVNWDLDPSDGNNLAHNDNTHAINTDMTQLLKWNQNNGNLEVDNSYIYNERVNDWVMFSDVSVSGMAYAYNKFTQITPSSTAGDVYALSWNVDQILQCYENCPKPTESDGSTLQEAGFDNIAFNARITHAFENAASGSNKFYIHKADDFSLYYCGASAASCTGDANYKVTCADCTTSDNSYYNEGKFVANGTTITNDSQLYASDLVYYRWATGRWENNKYPKKADNSLVVIDRPLQFDYTHTSANKRNTSDVITTANYRLEYAGDGDLWGIGWQCSDSTFECTPDANIADGVMLDTTGDGSNDSIILATRVDLRGASAAESTCTGTPHNLEVDNPASPKTLQTSVSTAARARVSHTWAELSGLEVIAGGEPCVIEGVNQSAVTGCSIFD